MNTNPIAFIDAEWSEVLCARHGEARNVAIRENCESEACDAEDCTIPAVYEWDSESLACVEFCGAGHSFCGSCGHDMEHGEDIAGTIARCHNCDTTSVLVDGDGFVYVDRLDTIGEHVDVTVKGTYGLMSCGTLRETPITAVLSEVTGWNLRTLRASLAYLGHMPWAGTVLLLTDTTDEAWTLANDHFCEWAQDNGEDNDADDADGLRFIREDVTLITNLSLRDDLLFGSK